jgi:feruloyl esterase
MMILFAAVDHAQAPALIEAAQAVSPAPNGAIVREPGDSGAPAPPSVGDGRGNRTFAASSRSAHPPAGDQVRIWIAIPTSNWNGRFLGTGGGGFAGGNQAGLTQPVAQGFAAGATDTGHTGGNASFALDANGRLNWQAIRNFAHVGIHEMTVTGKALTQAMYGVAPHYS